MNKNNWWRGPMRIWFGWNVVLFTLAVWLAMKQHAGNGDSAEGYGLFFLAPLLLIVLLLDIVLLASWMLKRSRQ